MFGVPSLELHAGSPMTVTAASVAAVKPREKTVKSRESDHQGRFCYDMQRGEKVCEGYGALGVDLNGRYRKAAVEAVWPVRGRRWR
jgi:hypothetical protein